MCFHCHARNYKPDAVEHETAHCTDPRNKARRAPADRYCKKCKMETEHDLHKNDNGEFFMLWKCCRCY